MAEANSGAGRPSEYKDEYAEQARKLCDKFGATDFDLSEFFEVSIRTIYNWKKKHPEFLQALKLGKEGPDDRVERALFSRAVGYTIEEEELFTFQGQVIRAETLKHYPPDITACLAWLNNRRPDQWRQKPEPTGESLDQLVERLNEARNAARANV